MWSQLCRRRVLCDNAAPFLWRTSMRQKHAWAAGVAVVVLIVSVALGQSKKAAAKPAAGAPDRAHLQKIWDGWSTLDPAKVADYYAQGLHTFFDIAPLKYGSWDEYKQGVVK